MRKIGRGRCQKWRNRKLIFRERLFIFWHLLEVFNCANISGYSHLSRRISPSSLLSSHSCPHAHPHSHPHSVWEYSFVMKGETSEAHARKSKSQRGARFTKEQENMVKTIYTCFNVYSLLNTTEYMCLARWCHCHRHVFKNECKPSRPHFQWPYDQFISFREIWL
jgi:hypothetical protein